MPASKTSTRARSVNSKESDQVAQNDRKLKAAVEDVIDQLASSPKKSLMVQVGDDKISFTNLDKVFWPKSRLGPAITKRDYASYLAGVSPYLLPHLKDRPITLVRLPNGIGGERFYQRHWDFQQPPFVETV